MLISGFFGLISGGSTVVPTADYSYSSYPQYSGSYSGYGYSATTCGLLSK